MVHLFILFLSFLTHPVIETSKMHFGGHLRADSGPTFTQCNDHADAFDVVVNLYGSASGFSERTNHSPHSGERKEGPRGHKGVRNPPCVA